MSNSFSARTSKSSGFCLIFLHFFYLKHKENNDTFINLKNSKRLILDTKLNFINKKPRYLAEVIKNKQYGLSPSKKDFWHQEELKLFFKSSLQFSKTYDEFAGKKDASYDNFLKVLLRLTALKYKAYIRGGRGKLEEGQKVANHLFCNFYISQRVKPAIGEIGKYEPYPFYIRIYIPLYPPIPPYSSISFILYIKRVKISNNSKCKPLKNQNLSFRVSVNTAKGQKSRSLSNFLKNKKLSWVAMPNFFVMLCNFMFTTMMQAFENQKLLTKNPKNVMLYLSLCFLNI
jgi:hypothetical protein